MSKLVCAEYVWTYNDGLSRLERNTGHQHSSDCQLSIATVGLSGDTDTVSAALFPGTKSLFDTPVTLCSDEVRGSRILSTPVGRLHTLTLFIGAHPWVLRYQVLCCALVFRDSDDGHEHHCRNVATDIMIYCHHNCLCVTANVDDDLCLERHEL